MSNETYNPAKSTSYFFTITNRKDISLKLQNASIGSVNLGSTMFPTPALDYIIPSNKLDFGPIEFRFLVSEDLVEYREIYKWMIDITRNNAAHLNNTETGELTIFDSNTRPILRVIYKGIWPMSLGNLEYSVDGEETSLVCNLTMAAENFDIEVVETGEKIVYSL